MGPQITAQAAVPRSDMPLMGGRGGQPRLQRKLCWQETNQALDEAVWRGSGSAPVVILGEEVEKLLLAADRGDEAGGGFIGGAGQGQKERNSDDGIRL